MVEAIAEFAGDELPGHGDVFGDVNHDEVVLLGVGFTPDEAAGVFAVDINVIVLDKAEVFFGDGLELGVDFDDIDGGIGVLSGEVVREIESAATQNKDAGGGFDVGHAAMEDFSDPMLIPKDELAGAVGEDGGLDAVRATEKGGDVAIFPGGGDD